MDKKQKRKVLTVVQKLEIINRLEKGEKKQNLMDEFNIASSTLYDIKSQKEKLMEFASAATSSKVVRDRKTLRKPQNDDVDKALYQWFLIKREEGAPITGPLLIEKAKDFVEKMKIETDCTFSEGWLSRFKSRHGIRKLDICGEKHSADTETAEEFEIFFNDFVRENNYGIDCIYNADETGVLFRCLPTYTLAGAGESNPDGLKKSKERITVLTCANASGSHRIKLLVIGKSKNPRSLAGIKHLPVHYKNQKNAWMNVEIFNYWFKHIFVQSVKNELKSANKPENSKILLLLDNCRAHPPKEDLTYENFTVMFLPPNVTSLIQPMDQGIIQNLKVHYRKQFLRKLIHSEASIADFQASFTIKDAIFELATAWKSIKVTTLCRGWRKLLRAAIFESDSSDEDFEGFRAKKRDNISVLLEQLKNSNKGNNEVAQLQNEHVESWFKMNEEVPTTEAITEEDIIQSIQTQSKTASISSDSDVDEGVKKVSWAEAEKSLSTFLEFCERNSQYTEPEIMELRVIKERFLKKRERSFKQTDIRKLFLQPSSSYAS